MQPLAPEPSENNSRTYSIPKLRDIHGMMFISDGRNRVRMCVCVIV